MYRACLALFLILVSGGIARAEDLYQVFITDRPYSGGLISTYTNRTNTLFQLTETPYVLLHVPTSASSAKWSWWTDPAAVARFNNAGVNTLTDLTMTLDWAAVDKTPGEWLVKASYTIAGQIEYQTVKFTFAPEPLSAGLFITGGSAFALVRRKAVRKQRRLG